MPDFLSGDAAGTTHHGEAEDQVLHRARGAVAVLFFVNGALFANFLPRYPEVKAGLGLTNTEFGLAVASFPLGALLVGLAAASLIRRFSSARVAVGATLVTGTGVLAASSASSWGLLAAAFFVAGAADAIADVAQNTHGLRVQRLYGRSILNSFHALWSMGAVLGGLMGAAAAGLDLARPLHLGISLGVFGLVTLWSSRFLLSGNEPQSDDDGGTSRGRTRGRAVIEPRRLLLLILLALLATAGAVVEDAGSSWSSLYLSGSLQAGASVAALGFVAMTGAQFLGRILGDRLVDRFGQRAVAQAGGVLITVGMGLALAFPGIAGTVAGFAAAGMGSATLIPAAMDAADRLPGLRPGSGLTIVSWLLRVGFLLAPPVVGAVADATNLRTGLLIVPAAGVLIICLAPVLAPRRHASPVS